MSASHRKPKRSRPSTIEQAKVERAVAGSPWPARPACGLPTLPVYEMALSEPVKPAYDKAWPLTEDEIDLPTEAPPELPIDPNAPVVVATLKAAMWLGPALAPIDLELRFAAPDAIEIGPMIFPFAQVLKLQRHLDEILADIRASIVMTARPSSEVR